MATTKSWFAAAAVMLMASVGRADFLFYGDQDVLGVGSYASDPTAGATLEGLPPGQITSATPVKQHGYPFDPEQSDFPGTDRIFVGGAHTNVNFDAYSLYDGKAHGPQVFSLDYGSLVPPGRRIATLTLGIATDDFQFPNYGQPYTTSINGLPNQALSDHLNSLSLQGAKVQFHSIGLDPGVLTPDHVLTLAIDQGNFGGDGWAIDYLSVGVTTEPVPEPAGWLLLLTGLAGFGLFRRAVGRRSR
ncbi:MAG TPA: PEP-CTERM sorting domain-containing protein [Thermoguttaceae bacterium]|nr:PEP-CTERM sorting domain-containing protein [Thermoguttaceae bacterium]